MDNPLLTFIIHLPDGRTVRTVDEEEAIRIFDVNDCEVDVLVAVTAEEKELAHEQCAASKVK